jgi:hypothetical protein
MIKTIQRLQLVSNLAFKFNYKEYLDNNKRTLVIFEIDTINRNYILRSEDPIDFLEEANKRYFDSRAGYLVNVSSQMTTAMNADLFSLSDIVLNANPADIDTIIIHELTHCLIESGNDTHITINEEALEIAQEIYSLTDRHNEYMTRHTRHFCDVLAQGCIQYVRRTRNFQDEIKCIKSAMRFDIFED